MIDASELFLTKAGEALAGAESELALARYNNCANRSYYACFQAAIAALIRGGIRPANLQVGWGHAFVQSQFNGQLVNRRHQFPSSVRQTLVRTFALRQRADYWTQPVARTEAAAALQLARAFVQGVEERGTV